MSNITRTTDEQHNRTCFQVVGALTAPQAIEAIQDFLTNDPTPFVLWDFTEGTLAGISRDGLRELIERLRQFAGVRAGGRTALVVPKDVDYGIGRVLEVLIEMTEIPFRVRAFRDMAEATAWLGWSGDIGL